MNWRNRIGLVVFLSLFTLLGAACSPTLEVVPHGAMRPMPFATVAPQQHDLAIVAVDFDPPLDLAQILSSGGVTLIVAVENRGRYAESNVPLTAQLLDPSDDMRGLTHETVYLNRLEPGTLRVVRFTQVSDLPVREHYQLVVSLAPVPGETLTDDNSRGYDIAVRNGN